MAIEQPPEPILLSVKDVFDIPAHATPDDMEEMVRNMSPEMVILWLARALDAKEGLDLFVKFLNQRVVEAEVRAAAKGPMGGAWKDPGTGRLYILKTHSRKAFTDIIGLWSELEKHGVGLRQFMGAISEVRVTDLRSAANTLDLEKKKLVLDIINDFRPEKESPPRFARLDVEDE